MAEVVIKTIFKLKRGTSTEWTSLNPLLEAGEPGFELDTGKLKIGNGVNLWKELKYIGGGDVSVGVDGVSIIVDGIGQISLAGFAEAQAGYAVRKGTGGKLEWYNPVTKDEITALELRLLNVETTIGNSESGLVNVVVTLKNDVNEIQRQLGDVYTKSEVKLLIDDEIAEKLADAGLTIKKVESTSDIDVNAEDAEKHIYLVPKEDEEDDIYDEYIVVDKKLELIGTTKVSLDGYVKKDEFTPIQKKVESVPDGILATLDKIEREGNKVEIVLKKSVLDEESGEYEEGAERIELPIATTEAAGLISREDKAKLDKIDPDEQSTITGAKIAGEEAQVEDKKIIVPIAGATHGVIKSSDAMSEVHVKEDGTAEIEQLGVDRLENVEGLTLVLAAGGAESV